MAPMVIPAVAPGERGCAGGGSVVEAAKDAEIVSVSILQVDVGVAGCSLYLTHQSLFGWFLQCSVQQEV